MRGSYVRRDASARRFELRRNNNSPASSTCARRLISGGSLLEWHRKFSFGMRRNFSQGRGAYGALTLSLFSDRTLSPSREQVERERYLAGGKTFGALLTGRAAILARPETRTRRGAQKPRALLAASIAIQQFTEVSRSRLTEGFYLALRVVCRVG